MAAKSARRDAASRGDSKKIYLIGFQKNDVARARAVTACGAGRFAPDEMPGSIYPLLASGEFGGSLIHTPNIYTIPWHCISREPGRSVGLGPQWGAVHFGETWMDERANMLRIPIAATACESDYAENPRRSGEGLESDSLRVELSAKPRGCNPWALSAAFHDLP